MYSLQKFQWVFISPVKWVVPGANNYVYFEDVLIRLTSWDELLRHGSPNAFRILGSLIYILLPHDKDCSMISLQNFGGLIINKQLHSILFSIHFFGLHKIMSSVSFIKRRKTSFTIHQLCFTNMGRQHFVFQIVHFQRRRIERKAHFRQSNVSQFRQTTHNPSPSPHLSLIYVLAKG